jgi:outer membrane protein assembly factor BamA
MPAVKVLTGLRLMLLATALCGAPWFAQAAEPGITETDAALADAAPTDAALPDEATLLAAGARIGTITIDTRQIFNLDDPRENKALYRLANNLHAHTHDSVIRAQLLFKSGDLYSGRVLQETERNLRTLRFLREPKVRATRYHDGVVDIEVVTHDVWTLQVGPTFGRSGGTNNSSFSFADQNFLGLGKTLILGAERNVDRTASIVEWRDPSINGSRWEDNLYFSNTSDGHVRRVSVWRPFYSLSARHAFGAMLSDSALQDTRYVLGDSFDSYRRKSRGFDLYTGWSAGLQAGLTRRLTLGWRNAQDEFQLLPETRGPLPADRKLSYPYLRADWIRDAFRTTRDLELIDRTEDVHLGLSGSTTLGMATRTGGSDRDAVLMDLNSQYGTLLGASQQLYLDATWGTRIEGGHSTDERYSFSAAWYWRHSLRLQTHAKITTMGGSRLDLDHYYSLGGDNWLRGYPLRYQLGSGLTHVKIEERFYSGYSLWRLFDVGAAAFVDAGRVHGGNPLGAPNLGWLKDAGLGLRLGNSRSSLGAVIHVDLATPLEQPAGVRSLQWLVSTKKTF